MSVQGTQQGPILLIAKEQHELDIPMLASFQCYPSDLLGILQDAQRFWEW